MNKETSLVELKELIAKKTTLPEHVIKVFLDQLFLEIENSIVTDSYLKLEGLGLFRVIKSGDSRRILFLGSKTPVTENLKITEFKTKLSELLPEEVDKNSVAGNPTDSSNDQEHQSVVFSEIDDLIASADNNDAKLDNKLASLPEKRRKSNLVTTSIIIIAILVIIAMIVLLINKSSIFDNKNVYSYTTNFIELENSDKNNYSYIVIPESDVSLQYISKTYYGVDDLWPYIYQANEDFVTNKLTIQSGAIIKIPKIMVDITEYHNGKVISDAKLLGNKIRQQKNIN